MLVYQRVSVVFPISGKTLGGACLFQGSEECLVKFRSVLRDSRKMFLQKFRILLWKPGPAKELMTLGCPEFSDRKLLLVAYSRYSNTYDYYRCAYDLMIDIGFIMWIEHPFFFQMVFNRVNRNVQLIWSFLYTA